MPTFEGLWRLSARARDRDHSNPGSLGYLIPMESWEALGSVRASRSATVIIVSLLAILLAFGCAPERPPQPPSGETIVAAGDIANCAGEGAEATARLVGGIEGTVLPLGDLAYPDGSAEDFEECYEPTWGQFKERTKPIPGNHEYETEGASAYFDSFGKEAGDTDKGYYSYDLAHSRPQQQLRGERSAAVPAPPKRSGSRSTSPPTLMRGDVP